MNTFDYGFIHVPKTGGTSIIEFLNKNYPNKFVCSRFNGNPFHSLTTSDVDVPIVIIRNPIDRFISSYYYWKKGPQNGPYQKVYRDHQNSNFSIDQFVDLLQKNKASVNTEITWNVHFKPQHNWIKEKDFAKTIVIKYKENLSDSVYSLMDYLKLPKYQHPLKKSNMCNYEPVQVSEYTMNYISRLYHQDFILWESILSRNSIFKLII